MASRMAIRRVWRVPWKQLVLSIIVTTMLRRHPIAQPRVVCNGIFFELEDGSACYQYEMLDLQRLMASYQDDHDNYAAEYKRRKFSQELMYYP